MTTNSEPETRAAQNERAERVAKALATLSIPELRKFVSEMEAELRKPVFKVVK